MVYTLCYNRYNHKQCKICDNDTILNLLSMKTNIKDVTIIAIKFNHPVYTDMLFSYSRSSQLGCILLPSWFLFCKENNKNTEYFMIVISFKSFTSSTCVFPVSSLTPYVKSKQCQNMKLKRKKINLKSISVMRAKIWTRFDESP